jgi:tRNA pseudouridine55 synthase
LATATLDAAAAASLLQGRVICDYFSQDCLSEGQRIRLYDQAKRFLGLGKITAGGEIAPSRLIGNV